MAGHIRSHNRFMEILDAIMPIADGMPDYKEPFALPAEHELNTAFVMEDLPHSENGQGYAWAVSQESWELKPYEPSEPTAALKRETEEELRAAEAELKAFVEKCQEGAVHRSDKEKATKKARLEKNVNNLKEKLKNQ
jgi:hypothetical protein